MRPPGGFYGLEARMLDESAIMAATAIELVAVGGVLVVEGGSSTPPIAAKTKNATCSIGHGAKKYFCCRRLRD
jgi:hypothetical protein